MHRMILVCFLGLLPVQPPSNANAAMPESYHIENAHLSISWAPASNNVSIAKHGGRVLARLTFAQNIQDVHAGSWQGVGTGETGLTGLTGSGGELRITLSDGSVGRIVLLDESPFAIIRCTLVGDKTARRTLNHVRPFEFSLDLPDPIDDLRALGTAGLTTLDKQPGSYAFLAIASPANRRGIVSGWLSHDRGSGVIFSPIRNGKIVIQPQIDYGCLSIAPSGSTESELFAIGLFDDARLGLEAYADAIAKYYAIDLPPIMTGYCTWYHRPHGGANDEVHLAELARQAARDLRPYGFQFVQIDDKWQAGQRRNGPANNFYAHNPKGPYPSGMKKAANQIRSLGLVPGLWFMPMAGDRQDPFFQQHMDWFVNRQDGTPYWANWGGTSLDMTNPATCKYVRSVVHRIVHNWGYKYLKMDGLWVGTATKLLYVNNGYREDDMGEAVFHDPNKTNIEAFRDGLKLVRKEAGPDVFLLGCCVSQNMRSFGGSFGLLDAMRIGPDNGAAKSWKGLLRGPWHGTNRYFLHGRVWYNDPDPVGVSPVMPLDHARVICSWVALTGQLNVFSEWLPELPKERIDLLRRTMPNHGLRPRPVDLFEHELANAWLLTDSRRATRRDVVGIFNWQEKEPLKIDYAASRIGLPKAKRYVAFDYWANRLTGPFSGELRCTLPGGTCRVLAVRPETDHPQLISTSRHITQGIVDVLQERWDAESQVLHGRSRVVVGDPYELRIVLPPGNGVLQAAKADISPTDGKLEGPATLRQDDRLVRIRFTCTASNVVDWQVCFSAPTAQQ